MVACIVAVACAACKRRSSVVAGAVVSARRVVSVKEVERIKTTGARPPRLYRGHRARGGEPAPPPPPPPPPLRQQQQHQHQQQPVVEGQVLRIWQQEQRRRRRRIASHRMHRKCIALTLNAVFPSCARAPCFFGGSTNSAPNTTKPDSSAALRVRLRRYDAVTKSPHSTAPGRRRYIRAAAVGARERARFPCNATFSLPTLSPSAAASAAPRPRYRIPENVRQQVSALRPNAVRGSGPVRPPARPPARTRAPTARFGLADVARILPVK